MPDPTNLVVDLYLSWTEAPDDSDEVAATLRELLADVPLAGIGRRVTVTVFDRGGDARAPVHVPPSEHGAAGGPGHPRHAPADRSAARPVAVEELRRAPALPAAEDTYLFHCVAPDNPADERLVALAEIRDVTPLRDAAGQVVAFPAVERALAACLDGIRAAARPTARASAARRQPRSSSTSGRRSRCPWTSSAASPGRPRR